VVNVWTLVGFVGGAWAGYILAAIAHLSGRISRDEESYGERLSRESYRRNVDGWGDR
jgi:hypothetical protein